MQDRYTAIGLYDDAADPRVVVPKRNPAFGWTLNIGHRSARMTLAAVVVSVSAALVIALAH